MIDPIEIARECGALVKGGHVVMSKDEFSQFTARVRTETLEEVCAHIRPLLPVGDVSTEYATGHAHAIYEAENAIRALLPKEKPNAN